MAMPKGFKLLPETKLKITNGLNNYYLKYPEMKKQRSESIKRFHRLNPEAAKNRRPKRWIYKHEPWMKTGKYFRTEENRKNIGLAAKGRFNSEETREKKRQHMLNEWKINPNRFMPSRKGTKATLETLIKLHYSHLGKGKPFKPAWSQICLMCKKEFSFPSGQRKNQIFCCRACYIEYKHITAKGIWKLSYPKEFSARLKTEIRYRDSYKCQLCGTPEIECSRKLDVHHIDYDRMNMIKDNLIALCRRCNFKVNYNRKYWKKYFQKLIKLKEVNKYGSFSK